MCAVVVFEVEIVIELFGRSVVECEKVVKTEKSGGTGRNGADSNSARRVQLIDMSEGGSTNRGCAFLYNPRVAVRPDPGISLVVLPAPAALHVADGFQAEKRIQKQGRVGASVEEEVADEPWESWLPQVCNVLERLASMQLVERFAR